MGLGESIAAASAVEKLAWLGAIGTFCVTVVRLVRWLARLEEAAVNAARERHEMREEIKGLREDINAFHELIIKVLLKDPSA